MTRRKEEWEKISRKGTTYKTKKNTYDLSGAYGIGYCKNGNKFYFSLEDYDKIKDYKWNINNGGYVFNGKNKLLIHHLILDYDKNCNLIPDHINRIRYDNRRENLRLITHIENCVNCSMQSNNTSGFIGISWDKRDKKWQANIRVNKKLIKIGRYKDIEEAKIARLKAEFKYFGTEIAPQRHLFKEYGIK